MTTTTEKITGNVRIVRNAGSRTLITAQDFIQAVFRDDLSLTAFGLWTYFVYLNPPEDVDVFTLSNIQEFLPNTKPEEIAEAYYMLIDKGYIE